jgi:hypothetical protein
LISIASACLLLAAPANALAEAPALDDAPVDVTALSLSDILSCKVQPRDYTAFALTLSDDIDPGGFKGRGWVKRESHNAFLSQYALPKPVEAFGQSISTIAFTASAMLAVIDVSASPSSVAAAGLDAAISPEGWVYAEKLIREDRLDDTAHQFRIHRVTKQVMTSLPSHPGKLLLGCDYQMDVDPY